MHLKTSVITLVVSVIAITLISSVVLLRDLDTIDDGGSVRWNITRVNGPLIMSKPILINAYNPFYWEDWEGPPPPSVHNEPCPVCCIYNSSRETLKNADAVLFVTSSLVHFEEPLAYYDNNQKPKNQLWVGFRMESPAYYPHAIEPSYLKYIDINMTYSLDDDVRSPYFGSRARYMAPVENKTMGLMAVFISNAFDKSDRLKYLEDLMVALPKPGQVNSYGRVKHNADMPFKDDGQASKITIMSHHKFCFALENSIFHDYVTEKFFQCLVAGSVPISNVPNIEEFAPHPRSYISISNFTSAAELAEYLLYLDSHDDEYKKYLEWKSIGPTARFRELVRDGDGDDDVQTSYQSIHPRCRLCMKIAQLKYGANSTVCARHRI